ncbi:MAG: sporulation protein YunB [Bacilli bacterium]
MKRARLKRKRKINKSSLVTLLLISFVFCLMLLFSYINNRITPILLQYAELETNRLASLVISKAITKELANNMDIDKLFVIIKNNDGEIISIDFNTTIVNKILATSNNLVQLNLRSIENGNIENLELPEELYLTNSTKNLKKGIIYEVPMGVVFNNTLLNNLGPKIPVKLNLIGTVDSNIKTNLREYGVNNAMIEVYVSVKVIEKVNLPFSTKKVVVETDIPVAIKLVQGKVPAYYNSNKSTQSPIYSLPITDKNQIDIN